MANIAFTNFYIDGGGEEFNTLFTSIRKALLALDNNSQSIILTDLMEQIGLSTEDVDARSKFVFVEGERGRFIHFRTETPYTMDVEFVGRLLEKYPNVNIYFEEEALEDGLFRCNDRDGKYFVGLNYILEDEDDGTEYLDTADELIALFKDRYDVNDVSNVTDVKEYIKHLNEVDNRHIRLITKQYV